MGATKRNLTGELDATLRKIADQVQTLLGLWAEAARLAIKLVR